MPVPLDMKQEALNYNKKPVSICVFSHMILANILDIQMSSDPMIEFMF